MSSFTPPPEDFNRQDPFARLEADEDGRTDIEKALQEFCVPTQEHWLSFFGFLFILLTLVTVLLYGIYTT